MAADFRNVRRSDIVNSPGFIGEQHVRVASSCEGMIHLKSDFALALVDGG
jgi:hypothetical protein